MRYKLLKLEVLFRLGCVEKCLAVSNFAFFSFKITDEGFADHDFNVAGGYFFYNFTISLLQ